MVERVNVLLFEDGALETRMARLFLPKNNLVVVGHGATLEESLELADRADELSADGALVDRNLPSAVKGDDRESEGSKIVKGLRATMKRTGLGMVIVEFATSTEKGPGDTFVPSFGGDYAVPKDGKPERYKEVAGLIKKGQ